MRSSLTDAGRGICAGAAVFAFVLDFLLLQVGGTPLPVLAGLFAVGIGGLLVAAGPSAVRTVFGGPRSTDGTAGETSWWLADVEPALEDAWNRWSDLVLVLGLAALGIGSFALPAVPSQDEPPLGLLVTGFLGVIGG
ncbi:hypothetical protein [Halosolutus gelatinilyticus]|uniref:hypothetical protein n=1 Tax=Halosolutus gelatinilyticus TaxID=2931975 RepID=UPI001FF33560|nr:hypothetical protein [Halosolutus gelatinilyticus]